ncbi:Ribosomal large subunit pseudouridine synthase D [Pseudoalteromonas luteoviolacea B = ATCC 29581]|nr:Ribosomal large subunit pseudouridine synthase D [Pseudoalteromonas luteoviolacea B = ATCC 29581]
MIANKPHGISFHSESEAGFVVQVEVQMGIKLYPVHRLDKVTSGLIVLAKSALHAAQLTELFSRRCVDKFYLAIIDAKPKKKQGWIKGDMAKSRRGAFKLLSTMNNPAITRFYTVSFTQGKRGVLLKPYSGKTHQLRVALKSLSAPILGDALYGGSKADRTYLHAYALAFDWHGQRIWCQKAPSDGVWYAELINHEAFVTWQAPQNLEW